MKNCNCITDIEKKMADFVRPRAGDDATAKMQNTVFYMDGNRKVGEVGGLEMALQIPFRIKGSKKGYTSEKGKEIGCNVAYCPFCGKPANRTVPEGQCDGLVPLYGDTP